MSADEMDIRSVAYLREISRGHENRAEDPTCICANWAADEIERLRAERADARKVARVFYRRSQGLNTHQRLAMKELYPWLEGEK